MARSENQTRPGAVSDREIVSTRVFAVSREQMFEAWTTPDRLARWWGPRGFKNTFLELNLRPGGTWRFIMHGPDGTDYRNESIFVEITHAERIVLDHVSAPKFRLIATFGAQDGKTKLTFRQVFETAEVCRKVSVYAVEANEQNFDRLEQELARSA